MILEPQAYGVPLAPLTEQAVRMIDVFSGVTSWVLVTHLPAPPT
jgi:hypothetical protein